MVFAAAGNQPVSTPTYPAAIPGVNAVTALGAPGQLASYANFGSFVEMALPGASVVFLGDQALRRAGNFAGDGLRDRRGGRSDKAANCADLAADFRPDAAEISRAAEAN